MAKQARGRRLNLQSFPWWRPCFGSLLSLDADFHATLRNINLLKAARFCQTAQAKNQSRKQQEELAERKRNCIIMSMGTQTNMKIFILLVHSEQWEQIKDNMICGTADCDFQHVFTSSHFFTICCSLPPHLTLSPMPAKLSPLSQRWPACWAALFWPALASAHFVYGRIGGNSKEMWRNVLLDWSV